MAKNKGKMFEKDIQDSAKAQELYILRLNDTSLSWQKEKTARFTPSNPADFLIYNFPNLFALECKSTKGTSISIQRTREEHKAMIHWDQIAQLQYMRTFDGIFSGFIFNFRDEECPKNGKSYWLDIKDFTKFINESNKKSINESDCLTYNAFQIEQHIKRVHFIYDIQDLLRNIERRESNGKTSL